MFFFRKMIKICKNVYFRRHLSVLGATDKSIYQKLRLETGFPFIKIKEALLKYDNDPVKARAWLEEKAGQENWEKAQKLSKRATGQGIVGILCIPGFVSMIALQCETESVSKNQRFKELLHHCTNALQNSDSDGNISSETLLKLSFNDKVTSEELNDSIGRLGENIKIKGSFVHRLKCPEISAFQYIHRKSDCGISELSAGAIGSLALFKNLNDEVLGNTIAQHIVGSENVENLLDQPLLQDESVTIGQLCRDHNFKIVDYCRLSAQ